MSSPSRKVGPVERLAIAVKSTAIGGALGILTPYVVYRETVRHREAPRNHGGWVLRAVMKSNIISHLYEELESEYGQRGVKDEDDWARYADESSPN
jgi:hypothetical protein